MIACLLTDHAPEAYPKVGTSGFSRTKLCAGMTQEPEGIACGPELRMVSKQPGDTIPAPQLPKIPQASPSEDGSWILRRPRRTAPAGAATADDVALCAPSTPESVIQKHQTDRGLHDFLNHELQSWGIL